MVVDKELRSLCPIGPVQEARRVALPRTHPPTAKTVAQKVMTNRCTVRAAIRLYKRFAKPPGAVTSVDLHFLEICQIRMQIVLDLLELGLRNQYALGMYDLVLWWLTEIEIHSNSIDGDLQKCRNEEFKIWLENQLASGAGGLHAATKETLPQLPDSLESLEVGTHAAQAIADKELTMWASSDIWDAVTSQDANVARFDNAVWPSLMPPRRAVPPPDTIRGVSKLFPWKTSTGGDSIHPRMVEGMSDTSLQYLGLLQVNAEVVGSIPELFRIIILFSRRKKTGSYRVVGNLTTFYRIWSRTRLPIVQDWERDRPSAVFWATAGRGADMAVHAAAVHCDIAVSKGRVAAGGLIDIWKCFEVLLHTTIVEQATLSEFPMDILRVAISMYQSERYLVLDKATAGPVYSIKGVTAGCSLAMAILRSTLLPTLEAFYNEVCVPRGVLLQVFVDDLSALVAGSVHHVVTVTPFVLKELLRRLETLYLHAANDKRKLIATAKTAALILPQLKGLNFVSEPCVEQLGIDFGAGRRSSHKARDKRANVFAARLTKIRPFTRTNKAAGIRMAVTAGAPSMAYGDLVYGTSETRLQFQRMIQHRTLLSRNSQRSMHLNLQIAGKSVDRAFHANSAPILHWARVVRDQGPDLKDFREAARFFYVKLRDSSSIWNSITGPISGVLATFNRIGWRLIGAHLVQLPNGDYVDLRNTATTKLLRLIDRATEKYIWNRHNRKDDVARATFSDGASSNAIRSLLRKGSTLSVDQRIALGSASTGGQWTQKRHHAADHTPSDLCLLCLAAVGTEWHRIHECLPLETRRTQFLSPGTRALAATQKCSHHDRWTRGHLPRSAYPAVPPQRPKEFAQWHNREPTVFTHEVFLDGSNSHPTRTDYSSNACSVASMKIVNGTPVIDAMLVVMLTNGPDGPEAAEVCAVEHALINGILPLVAWSDCANVVEGYRRGKEYCCNVTHPQCEHWRRVFARIDDQGPQAYAMLEIRKIKAHCTEQNYARYGMSLLQFRGNKWADKGANDTALLQATELGLGRLHVLIDKLEADHKSLVRWIAECTALVNDKAMRDAVPPTDKDKLEKPARFHKSGGSRPKRKRPTAPTGVARTFGLQDSSIVATDTERPTKYARLRDSTEATTQVDCDDEEATQAILTEIRILDELLEDSLSPPVARYATPTDSSCCAAEVTTPVPTEAEIFFAWEMGQEPSAASSSTAGPSPKRRQRLLTKTSPALASELGYSDEEDAEEPGNPETVETVHGGYMLRTAQFIWCLRCGASAQEGNVSKYLRVECKGKPPNASMRQRRSRLIRGANPNNAQPLNARATRISIS